MAASFRHNHFRELLADATKRSLDPSHVTPPHLTVGGVGATLRSPSAPKAKKTSLDNPAWIDEMSDWREETRAALKPEHTRINPKYDPFGHLETPAYREPSNDVPTGDSAEIGSW